MQLDQYLFLPMPPSAPGDFGCAVGWDGGVGLPFPATAATRDPPAPWWAYPWARWMRDGGDVPDGLGTETISASKLFKTTPANPLLSIDANEYRVMHDRLPG